jgi:spore coat polysaccharide biosynthesis predicted glycosyltransferase SpsG
MHVGLRVDGGPAIGYGHLVRTSALATELLADNHKVTVATTTPHPARTVFPNATGIVDLPSRGNPDQFVEWIKTTGPDAVFTDAYPVDTDYQQAVRSHTTLAVLQDDARHAICADLFVNGNFYAADIGYEFVSHPSTTCLGPDFVLLRDEVRVRAQKDVPWRESPERAVITMGGGDVAELTPTVVRAFDGFDLRVDAIVGPGCSETQEQEIHAAASNCSADVQVTRDPEDLVERMAQADFAVSTASTTSYELLALGTPMVCIPVVDNQQLIADTLQTRELATVLQQNSDTEAFRDAIERYVTDVECRHQRAKRGRTLVDGHGSQRMCSEIVSLASESPET